MRYIFVLKFVFVVLCVFYITIVFADVGMIVRESEYTGPLRDILILFLAVQ